MCEIIRNAQLIVIWSLQGGRCNAITGYEPIVGNAQYCNEHGQDAVFCALGHKPQTWGRFLQNTRAAKAEYP